MVKQYRAKTRKPKMRKTKGKKPTRKINLGKKKKTMRKRRRNGGGPNMGDTRRKAAIVLQSIARRNKSNKATRSLKKQNSLDKQFEGIAAAAHAGEMRHEENFKRLMENKAKEPKAMATIKSFVRRKKARKSRTN